MLSPAFRLLVPLFIGGFFASRGPATADEPDYIVMFGIYHHKQPATRRNPEARPSFLILRMLRIRDDERLRIAKHRLRLIEGHAMFAQIHGGLYFMPLEA
jgi:hypothetical protein